MMTEADGVGTECLANDLAVGEGKAYPVAGNGGKRGTGRAV
jgi:hypothetical protein